MVDEQASVEVYSMYELEDIRRRGGNPYYITVIANGLPLKMEMDIRAAVSVITETTYQATWQGQEVLTPQQITFGYVPYG